MSVSTPRPAPPRALVRVRIDPALAPLGAMMAAFAGVFSFLSVRRYDAFWQARFDVGNMVQAVWSVAHGHAFVMTSVDGRQVSRLGFHVDPILALFAPLWWAWPSPKMLLVAQALAVALGALPAFWLGRRWLGDERLALASAGVYLLYPPLQWATLTEFHPVTLAAPLLLFAIWAADEQRNVVLAVSAGLAALCKEEVGLALVVLGIWMAVRLGRRRAGAVLAGLSALWVAIAVLVVIPHFNGGKESTIFRQRYGDLGSDSAGVARTLTTHPWRALEVVATWDRLGYVLLLLVPVLGLSLLAPLLLAGAVPELALNLLSSRSAQHSIQFQYVAVIVPFVIASAILGLARLRRMRRPAPLAWLAGSPRAALGLVAIGLVMGILLGPLPWWRHLPLSSQARVTQYTVSPHSRLLAQAVALVPDSVPISASNHVGAHLSDRRRIDTFPVVADEDRYVFVDRRVPDVGDGWKPAVFAREVDALLARADFRTIFDRDGVLVLERRT